MTQNNLTHAVSPLRPYKTDAGSPKSNVAAGSLGAIIRAYKSVVTNRVRRTHPSVESFWQRYYYDHIIRDEREWNLIQLYLQQNPAEWAEDDENPFKTVPMRSIP